MEVSVEKYGVGLSWCVYVCAGDNVVNLIPYEVDMIIKASTETPGWHLV